MPRRILVVDDDESIREVAALSLQAVGGHEVVTVASGAEALREAAANPPDAILLDVMMPGLDGPETVSRLQADPRARDVDVILLTAKAQPSEKRRFVALDGVSGVISKPFDPMTLPRQIADILGWADH